MLISSSFVLRLAVMLCVPMMALSQTWTAKTNNSLGGSTGGYYEYLPLGYDPGKKYPTIIFIHGAGEVGNGTSQLPLVLNNAIPKMIVDGSFPKSVYYGGMNYSFIVIAPQFYYTPSPAEFDAVITNIANRYSAVDQNRIYLTGLSMGGGVIWEYISSSTTYASRPAAVVPICGASWPDAQKTKTIASVNLPVLATHNDQDPAVSVSTTIGYVDGINNNSPSPLAIKLIFAGAWHNAWDQTYATYEKLTNNLNFYEWILSNQKLTVLPVGLTDFMADKEPGGIHLKWATSQETKSNYFSVERSMDGRNFSVIGKVQASGTATTTRRYNYIDSDIPSSGYVYYRLKQTDLDGVEQVFKVIKLSLTAGTSAYKLYPTLVNNSLTLQFSNAQNDPVLLKVIDVNGKTLLIKKVPSRQLTTSLDVSGLAKGFYFLQIQAGEIQSIEKFIKQ